MEISDFIKIIINYFTIYYFTNIMVFLPRLNKEGKKFIYEIISHEIRVKNLFFASVNTF